MNAKASDFVVKNISIGEVKSIEFRGLKVGSVKRKSLREARVFSLKASPVTVSEPCWTQIGLKKRLADCASCPKP